MWLFLLTIVLVLWLVGWLVFEIAEGVIHLLLLVAVAIVLYRMYTRRRAS